MPDKARTSNRSCERFSLGRTEYNQSGINRPSKVLYLQIRKTTDYNLNNIFDVMFTSWC